MIFLPDTNVFSRYLRDRVEDAGLCEQLELSLADCRLSSIALMELEYGAAKRPEIAAFRERIARLRPSSLAWRALTTARRGTPVLSAPFSPTLNPTPSPSAFTMRFWPGMRWRWARFS